MTEQITKLGRYNVLGVLGSGAMGCVFEGVDPNLNRRVAIKTIKVENLSQKDADAYEARFRTEAHSAARLQHPNIVSVYDSDRDAGTAFLVMEFVDGKDLKHYLDTGTSYSLEQTLSIMDALLSALEYAHLQQIVHRDVKPANLLLTSAGNIKLTDFGVARIQNSQDATRTQGTVVGTLKYMSPEQIQGLPVDTRTDLFAAGVVLYQLLTGVRPFDAETDFSVIQKIVFKTPEAVTSINSKLPGSINQVITLALAKSRDDRYQTAAEFSADLKKVGNDADDLGVTPPCVLSYVDETTIKIKAVPSGSTDSPAPTLTHGSNSTVTQEIELVYWKEIRYSNDLDDLNTFLKQFPAGIYAALAQRRLRQLGDATVGSRQIGGATLKTSEEPLKEQDTLALSEVIVRGTRGTGTPKSVLIVNEPSRPMKPVIVAALKKSASTAGLGDAPTIPATHGASSNPGFDDQSNQTHLIKRPALRWIVLLLAVIATLIAVLTNRQSNSQLIASATHDSVETIGYSTHVASGKLTEKFVVPTLTATTDTGEVKALPSNGAQSETATDSRESAAANPTIVQVPVTETKNKKSVPEAKSYRRPPQTSRPALKDQAVVSLHPQQICDHRILLGFQICMAEQCAKPTFFNHAVCVERRRMEQQRREQEQYR